MKKVVTKCTMSALLLLLWGPVVNLLFKLSSRLVYGSNAGTLGFPTWLTWAGTGFLNACSWVAGMIAGAAGVVCFFGIPAAAVGVWFSKRLSAKQLDTEVCAAK